MFYKNRINHQQIVGKHCNAAARDKMLYYVRLNLSKYALSPIFTHEIPFINLYSNEVKNSNLGITSEAQKKTKSLFV